MIIDSLKNASQYYGVHPRLATGLRYLQENSIVDLEPGKYEIEGSDIYFLMQHYDSKQPDAGKWEAHRRYFDIQFVAAGAERIGYAPIDMMQVSREYTADGDYALFDGDGTFFELQAGDFTILAPQDVHMPCIAVQQPEPVKKIVVKVLI